MEMLVNRDTAAPSSSSYEPVKSDYCLCLAIHAPRKGIVEVHSFFSSLSWKLYLSYSLMPIHGSGYFIWQLVYFSEAKT
jgi:hypothetical protein